MLESCLKIQEVLISYIMANLMLESCLKFQEVFISYIMAKKAEPEVYAKAKTL